MCDGRGGGKIRLNGAGCLEEMCRCKEDNIGCLEGTTKGERWKKESVYLARVLRSILQVVRRFISSIMATTAC